VITQLAQGCYPVEHAYLMCRNKGSSLIWA